MTESPRRAAAAEFFAAYSDHDVDAMLALCAPEGTFRYLPEGERGRGSIREGAGLWRGFVEAMPVFRVEVDRLLEGDGFVVAETRQGGTPNQDIGPIRDRSATTLSPHCYILESDGSDRIAAITCYWDYDTIYAQLGHTERHD